MEIIDKIHGEDNWTNYRFRHRHLYQRTVRLVLFYASRCKREHANRVQQKIISISISLSTSSIPRFSSSKKPYSTNPHLQASRRRGHSSCWLHPHVFFLLPPALPGPSAFFTAPAEASSIATLPIQGEATMRWRSVFWGVRNWGMSNWRWLRRRGVWFEELGVEGRASEDWGFLVSRIMWLW